MKCVPFDSDLDTGLTLLADNGEGEMLQVLLDFLLIEQTTDETLGIEAGRMLELLAGGGRKAEIERTYIVRSGLLANWFFAASPINRSSSVKAIQDLISKG